MTLRITITNATLGTWHSMLKLSAFMLTVKSLMLIVVMLSVVAPIKLLMQNLRALIEKEFRKWKSNKKMNDVSKVTNALAYFATKLKVCITGHRSMYFKTCLN
jgi:hypothetical protein